MKSVLYKLLVASFLTLVLSFMWLRYPYVFPRVSENQAIALAEYFGTRNGEELADLEMYLVLFCSLVFSLVLVFVVSWVRGLGGRTSGVGR